MENSYAKARKAIIIMALVVTAISIASAIINWIANMRFYRNQKRISAMIANGEIPSANSPNPGRESSPPNPNPRREREKGITDEHGITYIGGVPHINGKPVNFF